jgi:hypothetical protein
MTPETMQRTAFHEHYGTDTGAVMNGKFFDIKNQCFFVAHGK